MGWLKKDDKFPEHRKIRRLTDSQYRLHDTALHACAKDETDGFVTEDDIADMQHGPRLRKHVDSLVKARLWVAVKGGWEINDYLEYNPSHAEQEAKRVTARERQARWRKGGTGASDGDVSRRDNAVTNALLTRTSQHPDPTRPDPSRPLKEEGSSLGGKSPKQDTGKTCPHGKPLGSNCGGCADARRSDDKAKVESEKDANRRERLAHEKARAEREAEAAQTLAEIDADPAATEARKQAAKLAARSKEEK